MKILQINCVYNEGSTGKITADLHNELLLHGIDSIVIYGRGSNSDDTRVTKICSEFYAHLNKLRRMVTGVMYGGCYLSTRKIIKEIKFQKPDIVHLQCINGDFVNIYKLITWLKINRIKTVITLHAEFIHTANCGYAFDCNKWTSGCGQCLRYKEVTNSLFWDNTHRSWRLMKAAFTGFDCLAVTSVSPWLMQRAKQSPVLFDKRHYVTMNGLDTDIFSYYDTELLRKELCLMGKKVVFHATSWFNTNPNDIKGGYYVLEVAKRLKDVIFVIAGVYPKDICVPDNVVFLGSVREQRRLAQLYSMADVTLIASKRETFSMIVAESLSCGTPVVGFCAGGPESISIPTYSKFVEHGNVNALSDATYLFLNSDWNKKRISEEATQKYSKESMYNTFCDVYNNLILDSN